MRWDHRVRSGSSTRPPPTLRPPSPCTSGKEEGKVADPKDGVSKGVEGCTEAEEVEVGRIDRMEVLGLAAAFCRCCGSCAKSSRVHTRVTEGY
jgi:hypothetical protein